MGARVQCAGVRFASRCGRGRSVRLHSCVACCERYTAMRSNWPSAATAARGSHVRAFHAGASELGC
eukprot:5987139-Lingulodinium_polyedra.AAC.1